MLELLSPAGSMDALRAAVQNGADAVYLGCGSFNARQGAKNFAPDELADAVRYCHVRGVSVHLTLNTLVTDREMPQAAQLIATAVRAGVDALIVQDLGLVALCRQMAPDMPLHGSTQMSIHSLSGVRQAAAMGLTRVVLARELSREQIAYICRNSPIQIEVFVHGALCMCYSGQCYMSAVIGQRSGNRGQCAQPCRLPYGYGRFAQQYPLSLKDNCLIPWLGELQAMGVASLKIEGRMKRPEYVATVTRIYRQALSQGKVRPQDLTQLRDAFSRQGFTQGYYVNQKGLEMFGVREKERQNKALFQAARASFEHTEAPLVPVRFYAVINSRQNALLAVQDDQGNICKTEGPMPQRAINHPLTAQELGQRLAKTGGTPYYCLEAKSAVEPGLSLPAAAINAMRREVLSHLTAIRGRQKNRLTLDSSTPPYIHRGRQKPPLLTVSVRRSDQITAALLGEKPAVLYVPLSLLQEDSQWLSAVHGKTQVAAVLPRVITDDETNRILAQLDRAYALGIRQALVGNLGHIGLVRSRGFLPRGDFGLNLFNSRAMAAAQGLALESATVSFELTLPQIRDLSKNLPTEMISYGRLPLMITENCIICSSHGSCACQNGPAKLLDRKGEEFLVLREQNTCRSVLYNGKKLYLLDKQPELGKLGLWAQRLEFTTENPGEVNAVLSTLHQGLSFVPTGYTRGLYFRGVE